MDVGNEFISAIHWNKDEKDSEVSYAVRIAIMAWEYLERPA